MVLMRSGGGAMSVNWQSVSLGCGSAPGESFERRWLCATYAAGGETCEQPQPQPPHGAHTHTHTRWRAVSRVCDGACAAGVKKVAMNAFDGERPAMVKPGGGGFNQHRRTAFLAAAFAGPRKQEGARSSAALHPSPTTWCDTRPELR